MSKSTYNGWTNYATWRVKPVRAAKPKKTATTAQLRKACQCALDLLENPDADGFDANQVIKQLREVLA